MTFDRATVDSAVDDLAGFLRADGADLLVRDADPSTDRIHLALVVDDVSCAECVLAPDDLRATIADALQRRIPGEFELILDDPRRAQ
jgi:Fe-S cluster biogenesis protein NfuA